VSFVAATACGVLAVSAYSRLTRLRV